MAFKGYVLTNDDDTIAVPQINDADTNVDGGLWTNMTESELKIRFDGSLYTVPTSLYERVRLRKIGVQSLLASNFTDITFDIEDQIVGAIHSTVTNPERITVSKTGMYLVSYQLCMEQQNVTTYASRVVINGTASQIQISQDTNVNIDVTLQQTILVNLTAGDHMTVQASVTNALDILPGATYLHVLRLY